MSASAAGGPNGPPGSGPNGQKPSPAPPKMLPPHMRRPKGNPMVPQRRPRPRPAGVHAPGTPAHTLRDEKTVTGTTKVSKAKVASAKSAKDVAQEASFAEQRKKNDGWSFPMPAGAIDMPIVMTKKSLREGIRHHFMRLAPSTGKAPKGGVNPANQDEFARPVTLQRRDPRQPVPGHEPKIEEAEDESPEKTEESERATQLKADREAQRALDDALKAPGSKDAKKKVNNKEKDKKPSTQANYGPHTAEKKKEAELRYEEALPWHLEDADNKNTWVGQYEAPLSYSKVALIPRDVREGGGYRMVPLEKWYKFTSKRGVNAFTIEEAEKIMGAKAPVMRWSKREEQRQEQEKLMAESRQIVNGRVNVKQESSTFRAASRREKMDHDDLDMSGDEFQDDDETAGFEPEQDEDAQDTKDRVRREQLGANLFGDANEKEVDKQEETELKEELTRKLLGKDVKKSLQKRDKQFQYDSDDSERERDPFASSSDSDSETEDEDKKESDKDKDKDKDKDAKDNTKSKEKEKDKTANAKAGGTNTTQGVQGKKGAATTATADSAPKSTKGIKRAGSPVSDSSGAESTRKSKKQKKAAPSTTSIAGSRSATPNPAVAGSNNLGVPRRPGAAGSTSDGEATAGEMSDGAGGKIKTKKKNHGNNSNTTNKKTKPAAVVANGTTTATATANTNGATTNGATANGSRPTSPNNHAPVASPTPTTPSAQAGPISVDELVHALADHPEGISITRLTQLFEGRIQGKDEPLGPGQTPRQDWIRMVKLHARWASKLLYPKN